MKAFSKMKYVVLLVAGIMLSACNPQERAVEDLRSFTERLETSYSSYSEADWDDALAHYSEICETIEQYKRDYSPEQLEEIDRLKGRCQAVFVRHAVENGVDDFMQNLHQYKGMLEGLLEGL